MNMKLGTACKGTTRDGGFIIGRFGGMISPVMAIVIVVTGNELNVPEQMLSDQLNDEEKEGLHNAEMGQYQETNTVYGDVFNNISLTALDYPELNVQNSQPPAQ